MLELGLADRHDIISFSNFTCRPVSYPVPTDRAGYCVTLAENASGTESLLTLRWREMDSNPRSPSEGQRFSSLLFPNMRAPPPPSKTLAAPSSSCFFQL